MSQPSPEDEAKMLDRHFAVVRFEPGPPPGYEATLLECGHKIWFPMWPMMSTMICAQCIHEVINAFKE